MGDLLIKKNILSFHGFLLNKLNKRKRRINTFLSQDWIKRKNVKEKKSIKTNKHFKQQSVT